MDEGFLGAASDCVFRVVRQCVERLGMLRLADDAGCPCGGGTHAGNRIFEQREELVGRRAELPKRDDLRAHLADTPGLVGESVSYCAARAVVPDVEQRPRRPDPRPRLRLGAGEDGPRVSAAEVFQKYGMRIARRAPQKLDAARDEGAFAEALDPLPDTLAGRELKRSAGSLRHTP